jgi:small subunit ribosomal protein S13
MVRISGVNLPSKKRIEYALPYIYGVGLTLSRKILKDIGLSNDIRTDNLTDDQVARLQGEISNYILEGDLRKTVLFNIRRLQQINSYRGSRHKNGLPVRGQRTKTNARTRKGPKKAGSQIALKKAVSKK